MVRHHRLVLLRCSVLLSLLAVAPVEAQVNTETLAANVSGPGWGGGAEAKVAYAMGNVDSLNISGSLSLRFATAHPDSPEGTERFWFLDRALAYGSSNFQRVGEEGERERIASAGYGHLRYTRMQWLHLGGEVFGQAQYDEFRLLRQRLLAGTGARVVFYNDEHFGAWLGSGYMFEYERRDIAPENQDVDPTRMVNHRWNNYLTLRAEVTPEQLTVTNTVYAQPRFDAFGDIQVLNETALRVMVWGHLTLTTSLFVRYDSRAPQAVEKLDVTVANGLAATF